MHQQNFTESPARIDQVEPNDWVSRTLPWLIIGGIWVYFFGPMIVGSTTVGYRDSANLYYPLFKATSAVWGEGRIPLWNPYCNFGFPSVADGSTSIFYPGKLIFALSFLSFPQRYGSFLAFHSLLAAVNAFVFARAIGCRRPGATLASVSFAFGAPVVFQVTNVIYLVSAAWLPLALSFIWSAVKDCPADDRSVAPSYLKGVVGTSVCCAMMILGGDPQMVYHVGLIAFGSLISTCLLAFRDRDTRAVERKRRSSMALLARPLIWCGLLVVVTACLSAVQLIPTQRLAQRSERSAGDRIVNVYSAITATGRGVPTSDIATALLQTEDQVVGQYQFSQPPWSLGEMLLPNVSGKPFPINGRWTSQLKAADRVWFPSIYLGCFIVLLAAGEFRLRGITSKPSLPGVARRSVWLSWIGLVFLLGSFGWYGFSWLWHEIEFTFSPHQDSSENWAAPVGGVYWWMSTLLPKYFSFRYPAKLFVLVAIIVPVLAGLGFDRRLRDHWRTTTWLSPAALAVVGASGLVVFGGILEAFGRTRLTELKDSENEIALQSEFGPFDPELAASHIEYAILQFVVVMALLAVVTFWMRRGKSNRRSAWAGWLLVAVVATDLAVANRWLLAEVRSSAFESTIEVPVVQDDWIVNDPFLPAQFLQTRSTDRLEELILWQRTTMQPKHHLLNKQRQIGSFHSIWPAAYQQTIAELTHNHEAHDHKGAFDDLIYQSLFGNDSPVSHSTVQWNALEFEVDVKQGQENVLLPVLADDAWQADVWGLSDRANLASDAFQLSTHSTDLLELRLPAGRWGVRLEYWPRRLFIGAIISVLAWGCYLAWGLWRLYD